MGPADGIEDRMQNVEGELVLGNALEDGGGFQVRGKRAPVEKEDVEDGTDTVGEFGKKCGPPVQVGDCLERENAVKIKN